MPIVEEPDEVLAPSEPKPNDPRRDEQSGLKPLVKVVIGIVVVFAVILIVGLYPRLTRNQQLNADAQSQTAAPIVNSVPVQAPPAFDDLDLPGDIEAAEQTAVVARASGYVKRYLVDIGDKVQAGQTLATIESPDLDQQVDQTRAQLGQAQAAYFQAKAFLSNQQAAVAQSRAALSRSDATLEQARTQEAQARAALAQSQQQAAQQQAQLVSGQANLDLAKVTATRYENLLADGAIDRQTTDQEVAAYKTNQANVQALQSALLAGQANVDAFRSALSASASNVKAFASDIQSSRAALEAAQDNVTSAVSAAQAAQANVASNQDNVARMVVLQQFENVTAPFSGTITARNIDNGSLISASGTPTGSSNGVGSSSAGTSTLGNAASGSASSTSGGGSTSLFSIAQLATMQVYISVPQYYAGVVQVGQTASVSVDELPGKIFTSVIKRTAGAFDPASRTLVTEVSLNNPGDVLRPGMFATVHLRLPHPGGNLLIPDSSLVTGAAGNQVVLIEPDSTIHFQPITLGRDFGQVIEVTSGLQMGRQIVASPPDSLLDGEKVTVQPLQTPPAAGGTTPSGGGKGG
jgi:multidrug efflux pump subunit AcrA (membrane-fusion protein)